MHLIRSAIVTIALLACASVWAQSLPGVALQFQPARGAVPAAGPQSLHLERGGGDDAIDYEDDDDDAGQLFAPSGSDGVTAPPAGHEQQSCDCTGPVLRAPVTVFQRCYGGQGTRADPRRVG